MYTGKYFIEKLGLKEHPEGGYYSECLKSSDVIDAHSVDAAFGGDRRLWTSIYFLLNIQAFVQYNALLYCIIHRKILFLLMAIS